MEYIILVPFLLYVCFLTALLIGGAFIGIVTLASKRPAKAEQRTNQSTKTAIRSVTEAIPTERVRFGQLQPTHAELRGKTGIPIPPQPEQADARVAAAR